MASRDTISKNYMRNPEHFADFYNGFVYGGREVLKSEDLVEVDTSNIAIIPCKKGTKPITIQKYRDILKKAILMSSGKAYYLFLGIENQSNINYAMPIRSMLYDALVYNEQVETIAKSNKEKGLFESGDEFLSGITKNDKLIPIITVTLYWGSEPWDAPKTLKDMLIETDSSAERFINDFDCNLFSIVDTENLPEFRTELNELFRLLSVRNNGNALNELVTNNANYQSISRDTAVMMHEFADIKLPRKNKEGKYNMCKAIDDIRKMGVEEGIEKGIERGVAQGIEATWLEAIRNTMNNAKKTFEEACVILGISEENMAHYKNMI